MGGIAKSGTVWTRCNDELIEGALLGLADARWRASVYCLAPALPLPVLPFSDSQTLAPFIRKACQRRPPWKLSPRPDGLLALPTGVPTAPRDDSDRNLPVDFIRPGKVLAVQAQGAQFDGKFPSAKVATFILRAGL